MNPAGGGSSLASPNANISGSNLKTGAQPPHQIFSVVSSSSSHHHHHLDTGVNAMNNASGSIISGAINNSVVILQKPLHQRGNAINDDTEDDSEDDIYEDDDMDSQSVDESVNANEDKITSQLASAGPTGMAAAAAISSTKKRKKSYAFETNPSIRKRQQTRILRKLRQNIEEYSLRVGQQAVVLVATPGGGKSSQVNFRAFGAKPLEDVVKSLRAVIMTELETALAQQAPPTPIGDPSRYELPPLVIDGIPTPVEKMTQAQLRAFIPLMLKYSTGRGKPGWGKDTTKPPWWPEGVPWANVRMDARKTDDKQKVSWTHALRQIVTNCYEYHGRQDLLPIFSEADAASTNEANGNTSEVNADEKARAASNARSQLFAAVAPNEAIASKQGGVVHHVNIKSESTASSAATCSNVTAPTGGIILQQTNQSMVHSSHQTHLASVAQQYATQQQQQQAIISNPDGTISIIHVDPENPIITLPDGTTALIQGIAHQNLSPSVLNLVSSATANNINQQSGSVHTLAEVAEHHAAATHVSGATGTQSIELAGAGDLHTQEGSQFLIAGEDGQAYPVSGMITVPVSASMYQAVIQGQGVAVNAALDTGASGGQLVQVMGTPIQLATTSGIQHLVKLDPTNIIKIDHDAIVQNSSIQHLPQHPQQSGSNNNLSGDASTTSATVVHGAQSVLSNNSRNLTITPVTQGPSSSTVHHLPSDQGTSQGMTTSNHLVSASGPGASVIQIGRQASVASKTSVSSTTGRFEKDQHSQRRSANNNITILPRSSPPGTTQPDTTGVD